MPKKDKRVDAYIAQQAEFARPILIRVRELVHACCPDCEETLKWGAPTFMHNGILCIMAGFKAHCMVRFWKGSQIKSDDGERIDTSWGNEARYSKLSDLPSKKEFLAVVKKAIELNASGAKAAPRKKQAKPPIPMPPEFAAAIKKSPKAKKAFDAFPPSHKREYLEWITGAKRDETRVKRIAQAIEWMAEGKQRNWKYG
jgi:uncharacterized protein YdeI (YjbR/CyaY-like superfamily)